MLAPSVTLATTQFLLIAIHGGGVYFMRARKLWEHTLSISRPITEMLWLVDVSEVCRSRCIVYVCVWRAQLIGQLAATFRKQQKDFSLGLHCQLLWLVASWGGHGDGVCCLILS